jgi:DNA-binding SARP family transcriptional activator
VTVNIGLLGPLTVTVDGGTADVPGLMDRAVLVHLVLAQNRAVSVGSLAETLWNGNPPAAYRNAIQVKVSRLRAALGAQASRILHSQGAYRLDLPWEETDAGKLAVGLKWGEAALAAGDVEVALRLLTDAAALWRGDPLAELTGYPQVRAAREQFRELWMQVCEARAEAMASGTATAGVALVDMRALLAREPLRPRARTALMTSLDVTGRRGEALAVYDAGRRLLAEVSGLQPPAPMQKVFNRLLAQERDASRLARPQGVLPAGPPDALFATARWLSADGQGGPAIDLALRGVWWWWLSGKRHAGRDLLEDLLAEASGQNVPDGARLGAAVWLDVLALDGPLPAVAATRAQGMLGQLSPGSWRTVDAIAAVLLAEKLSGRGERPRALRLLAAATVAFRRSDDEWGLGLCRIVQARTTLLAGDVTSAECSASAQAALSARAGDDAGHVLALDVLGYGAEIRGDFEAAARLHAQALAIARRTGATAWEAAQLTRLGNVGVLAGDTRARGWLAEAAALARDIGSASALALAHNGAAAAAAAEGDASAAAAGHRDALAFYEGAASLAGIAYTTAALGLAVGRDDPVAGLELIRASVGPAVETSDPRALAYSLEGAAVLEPDPVRAAGALAAARALRSGAGAPLPAAQAVTLRARERQLAAALGEQLIPTMRRSAADPAGEASTWRTAPNVRVES